MNTEIYKNFITVIECGTITAAADKIHIAQPALSNQIRMLEKEFNAQLIRRSNRNRQVELTEAGRLIYARIKTICQLEEDAYREVRDCVDGGDGTLRIGVISTIPLEFIKRIIISINEKSPSIRFNIYEGDSSTIADMLKQGIIELGIVRMRHEAPTGLNSLLTVKEWTSVIFNRKNQNLSVNKNCISIADLRDVPLSLPRGLNDRLVELCLQEGFIPNVRSVSGSLPTLLSWADEDRAAAIVHLSHFDELPSDTLCCTPLLGSDLETQRMFLVANNICPSNICNLFIDHATKFYT